eukprot:10170428-Alexandrium_andersonii.AAC.1
MWPAKPSPPPPEPGTACVLTRSGVAGPRVERAGEPPRTVPSELLQGRVATEAEASESCPICLEPC